ncbi:hypothetical protein BHM03_00003535, partial [Ensete ventricosum]
GEGGVPSCMETRSRKRAEASSSAPSSQPPASRRPSKRSRTNLPPPSTILTRSRRSRNSSPPLPPPPPFCPMDSSAGDSSGRRRGSGKNHHPPAERDRDASDKGKERDPEASRSRDRARDRDAGRILGLSFDGGGADDDNDSEGGASALHQNLTSTSSALQGLLRKLGAGLDDLLPSSALLVPSSSQQSSRLKKILTGLRADGEEGRQVEALTQLCDMLSIGTEDSLGSFSVDSFVPVLVGLLNHESNPDIMLLAARALTHLCDVLPSSCSAVVHYGAVPCFCARLLTIEYMDLAEQVYEIVNLVDELLPPLPQGTISTPICYNIPVKGSSIKKSTGITPGKPVEPGLATNDVSAREKLLQEQPELLQQFGTDLLPVLTQVWLMVFGLLLFFLAGILAWKDPQVLIPALQIAEVLMEKLPGTFSKIFVREGVVHAVDALICPDTSSSVPSQASISEKDGDSAPVISSRSRRYRRRSGGLNTETGSVDESKHSLPVVGSPPNLFEIPPPSSSLRASVSACAKSFKDKFFPAYPDATDVGVTDDLLHLKNLCTKLNSSVETVRTKGKGKSKASLVSSFDISSSIEEELDGVISEMLAELSKADVSTFEFIGSGVVLALLSYLSCGTFGKEKISEANLPKLRKQALRRYRSFITTALPDELKGGHTTPMTVLVQKLQNALTSLERFPVVLSHLSRSTSGSARLSSGLSALSQHFKLRLCRAPGEKSLRDYSSNIVLIEPLASLAVVEEFLWPRVKRIDSGQKSSASAGNSDSGSVATGAGTQLSSASTASGHRPSTRSRSSVAIGGPARNDAAEGSSNSAKGKGKAVLKFTSEEARGPQTRKATRRRVASDKDAEMKPALSDSGSEVGSHL